MISILKLCHASPVGVHHGGAQTAHKIYDMNIIGLSFTNIPMIVQVRVTNVKVKETLREDMNF